ncbi:ATP-binding protein [Baia soyae]|uniref:histidine kinase n=1 Tax=Baia soyae TaxID=1544746 RepID=A0A4V2SYD8_9BACL|nr:ATP-binding protein [Baia soyae]TCP69882.1 two-component system sensor histidine kinase ResE [Baia soyae]
MILRSVVGKLWLTIIVLVSLVLILLSLFLSEQVEQFYEQDQLKSLKEVGEEIQNGLTGVKNHANSRISSSIKNQQKLGINEAELNRNIEKQYVDTVTEIAGHFHTHVVITDFQGKPLFDQSAQTQRYLDGIKSVLKLEQLQQELTSEESTARRTGKLQLPKAELVEKGFEDGQVLVYAIPYLTGAKIKGAIVLFQKQGAFSEQDIKKWIFYSALIGIALTTVFAFFLSTRITQPLIQMQRAAEKMARGKFSTRVMVRAHERDEIAELAMTFNQMAGQLEESINLLSHEKEQLTSILRSMSDGVISINAHGKIILSNPPAERFLNLYRDPQDFKQNNSLPPTLLEVFRYVLEDEAEQVGDIEEQGRTWQLIMAPLYAREQVRGAVAVMRDVTEERHLEKLRKDFVANVSHELRTPLSMLQGYSEALLDDIADSPEMRQELAQIINDESQRMSRLVNELLDLARMEAGHIDLVLSELPVKSFVDRVTRKFSGLAGDKKIELIGEVQEDVPIVYWDEDRMEQILTNLIGNAIQHTPENGRVTVRAKWLDHHVYLEVEDTGTGIPIEDLPYVFQRFYKADKARTRKTVSGGTGLGLAIAKHLVHAHNGKIYVRSELGVGTTFCVQLPQIVEDN